MNLQFDTEEEIENAIEGLVIVLRKILENLRQEQQGILHHPSANLETICSVRLELMDKLGELRDKVAVLLTKQFPHLSLDEPLIEQLGQIGSENVSMLLMRDQLKALCQAIEHESMANQELLKSGPISIQRYALDVPTPKKVALALLTPGE